MTAEDIRADLSLLYLDTAATGTDASLAPEEVDALGRRAFDLFPAAARRHRAGH
jgi:hypothetical protein